MGGLDVVGVTSAMTMSLLPLVDIHWWKQGWYRQRRDSCRGDMRMATRLRTCNGGNDDSVVCTRPDVFVLTCIHSLWLKGEGGWGTYQRVLLRAPAPIPLACARHARLHIASCRHPPLRAAPRLSLPAPALVCVRASTVLLLLDWACYLHS